MHLLKKVGNENSLSVERWRDKRETRKVEIDKHKHKEAEFMVSSSGSFSLLCKYKSQLNHLVLLFVISLTTDTKQNRKSSHFHPLLSAFQFQFLTSI